MNAVITAVKRFAVHDGDGIRTTIFFKGCPLRCKWCHNPETMSFKPEIGLFMHKCTSCGKCAENCENHRIENGKHLFDRLSCKGCGKCSKICPNGAIEFYGKEMSVNEICEILAEDKIFYDQSGGGITLSGGECLMQAEVCRDVLKKMKSLKINTAVDTCGYVPRKNIDKVIEFTDVFLYDIKHLNSEIHKECTGKGNEIILSNLEYISAMNKKIEIRIPVIPNYNDNNISEIYEYLKKIKNITKIRTLKYHNYAQSKYAAIGSNHIMPEMK